LIVGDDFVVANEIDMAPCDAGFEVAGVAASADEAMKLGESQKSALAVRQMLTPVAVTRETLSHCSHWALGIKVMPDELQGPGPEQEELMRIRSDLTV